MNRKPPAIGTVLRSEDGRSVVVAPATKPIDALRDLLTSEYGGTFAATNPALTEVAAGLKVEVWHSCTRAWIEAEGVDANESDDWWAPHGDGRRSVHVVCYEGDIYDLGDRANSAEPVA